MLASFGLPAKEESAALAGRNAPAPHNRKVSRRPRRWTRVRSDWR
jgi:hypothetical protein